MKRTCITCGVDISHKRADARYCSDACRKYFKRKGSRVSRNVAPPPLAVPRVKADKSGLIRTPSIISPPRSRPRRKAGSDFADTFRDVYRKKGDLFEAVLGSAIVSVGGFLEEKYRPQAISIQAEVPRSLPEATKKQEKKPEKQKPLSMQTAQQVKSRKTDEPIALPEAWQVFLGPVVRPFRMLVWGLPGSGKSTFVLKLLDTLNATAPTLYISAEEPPGSATLIHRIGRVMQHPKKTLIIERLPVTVEEWYQVAIDKVANEFRQAIAFDSLTVLGLTPFDHAARLNRLRDESQPKLTVTEALTLFLLAHGTSLIWITHAYKDGKEYRGDGSWAHEADIVVKCEAGKATILKNRFGESGRTLELY